MAGISGIPVKKAPLYKKAPPIEEENLLGGAFLVEHSAGGGKFWGFECENDDFVKENRVRKVRKGKIFPPAAGQKRKGAKNID